MVLGREHAARGDPAGRHGLRGQPDERRLHERDPRSGERVAGSKTASLPAHARIDQMVGLRGGTVLAVGSEANGTESTPVAYVYDPAEDTWTGVQGLARSRLDLVALPDGGALAIGGNDGSAAR